MERKDIESLGWVLHENSNIYCKGIYMMMYSVGKLRVWHKTSNVGFSDTMFEGTIKNKSELKKLLIQLGI